MNPETSGEAAPASRPALKELQTRFLRPFFFDRRAVQAALKILGETPVAGFEEGWAVRSAMTPHGEPSSEGLSSRSPMRLKLKVKGRPDLYTDEVIEHVANHLFPPPPEDEDGAPAPEHGKCGYARLATKAANRMFRDLTVDLQGNKVPVSVEWTAGVEIFLSPQGVGVLSLAFVPHVASLDEDTAIDFNYLIATTHTRQDVKFRMAHRSDDTAKWAQLKEGAKASIPQSPPAGAGLQDRLGAPGGDFTLSELANYLLAPLTTLNLRTTAEGRFSVYTVARYGSEVDFQDESCRKDVSHFVSALAQLEEPSHAGFAGDHLHFPNEVLNRRHWAATTLLASAHVVSDQPPGLDGKESGYNSERVPRVRDKYFVPYLVATYERLSIQRALDEACAIVSRTPLDNDGSARQDFSRLTSDLLDFSVGSNFTQISTRHALHSFFKLSREGLDLTVLWNEVRHAIFDMNARYEAKGREAMMIAQEALSAEQAKMAKSMDKSLKTSVKLQEAVHVIEVFLVVVYSAHLAFMFTEALKPKAELKVHWAESLHEQGFEAMWSAMTLAGLIMLLVMAWRKWGWKHTEDQREGTERCPPAQDVSLRQTDRNPEQAPDVWDGARTVPISQTTRTGSTHPLGPGQPPVTGLPPY